MKLTTKGQYAVAILQDIYVHSGVLGAKPVPVFETALRLGLSLHYSEQIARKLRQAELIKSVRGPGGGYIITRDLESATLKYIFDSVGEVQDFKTLPGLAKAVSDYLRQTTMRSLQLEDLNNLNT